MNEASITLNISLPLDAGKEAAVKAINAIQAFFDDGISPKDAATVNAHIAGATADAMSGTTNTQAATTLSPQNAAVDKTGIPWDERIHSSSKNFNKDGTWRARKGVDDATARRIDAEIRAAISGGQSAPAASNAVSLPNVTPQLPLPPVALPAVQVENAAFTDFVQFIAANTAPLGRIPNADWVKQSLAALGVPGGDLQNLAHNPDLLAKCKAAIETALGVG